MIVAILTPSVRPCDPPRQREQQVTRHRIGEAGERRDAGHGGEVGTDLVHVGLGRFAAGPTGQASVYSAMMSRRQASPARAWPGDGSLDLTS
ncbi:hypothetical protein ABT093_11915 [Kitasatospora sp. NPDC002551]|uniref:hypothetical protein n=1 Tax=unclassified Kitasatospora TaxID=2633591 RepID=UPI00331FC641